MRSRTFTLMTLIAIAGAATPAVADWDVGDLHKMHYPQLPDPNGIDVSMRDPEVVADDWQCSGTGPVTDIHFWFSVLDDAQPEINSIHVSIHRNIIPNGQPYSRPGALLWERQFTPTDFTVRLFGTGDQGWYVPENGFYEPSDHLNFYQMNIENIVDPFIQEEGTIYWLDISVNAVTPIGWKTSMSQQFMDTSVWGILPDPIWMPIFDPRPGKAQLPLDLAFVITPEPGVLLLLVAGTLVLRRR